MRSIITVFILLILANNSKASVKKLVEEFISKNSTVLKSKSEVTLTGIGVDLLDSKRDWALSYSAINDSNKLTNLYGTNTQQTKSLTHSLGVSRDFLWGGHFSFSNNLSKINQERINALTPATYGFDQSVNYTQDFGKNLFGVSDKLELEIAREGVAIVKTTIEGSVQLQILGFYSGYMSAKLNQTLLNLNNEALKRSVRRTAMIKRRVRDGLRDKVDLIQARISELNQRESVKSVEIDLKSSLEKVSNMIHRRFLPNEVQIMDFESVEIPLIPKGEIEKNIDIKLLKQKIENINKSLRKTKFSFIPAVSLSTMYKTNQYNRDRGDAISDGRLGKRDNEIMLTFSVGLPLEFKAQKAEEAKYSTQLKIAKMEEEKSRKNFFHSEESLLDRIKIINANIESVKKRRGLAKRALKEYNKLYSLGRADLDQVIRAEESLINTEYSFAGYLMSRDVTIANLASLYGNLHSYLLNI